MEGALDGSKVSIGTFIDIEGVFLVIRQLKHRQRILTGRLHKHLLMISAVDIAMCPSCGIEDENKTLRHY